MRLAGRMDLSLNSRKRNIPRESSTLLTTSGLELETESAHPIETDVPGGA